MTLIKNLFRFEIENTECSKTFVIWNTGCFKSVEHSGLSELFDFRKTLEKPNLTYFKLCWWYHGCYSLEHFNVMLHKTFWNSALGTFNNEITQPTLPTWGHILHWYFLPLPPVDPFELCKCPPAWPAWPPLTAALIGWGTTSPVGVWPAGALGAPGAPAGGLEEADELLLWPYRPAICWLSSPRSSKPEIGNWYCCYCYCNCLLLHLVIVGNVIATSVSNCFVFL